MFREGVIDGQLYPPFVHKQHSQQSGELRPGKCCYLSEAANMQCKHICFHLPHHVVSPELLRMRMPSHRLDGHPLVRLASNHLQICAPSAGACKPSLRHRTVRQSCCSGKNRNKGSQIQPSLTHEQSSHASTTPPSSTSQRERVLAFENAPAEVVNDEHDHDHDHEAPINDSRAHKILAWIFSRVGLLQLAAQLRGKAWNAITIACLMAIALLTAWAGSTQAVQAQVCSQISTAATATIYILAGIPELVDLCFDLTAGHVDTHVLMTLAVFGTLAIGGALEVTSCTPFVLGLSRSGACIFQ